MGVDLSPLITKEPVKESQLKGKEIGVDTYLELHTLLKSQPVKVDGKGRVVTHLEDLLQKTVYLLESKIKPVFVLDGPFPEIRKHSKITDKTASPRTTNTISLEMMKDLKSVPILLGIPIAQAPSEAEAQCAHMCLKGDIWTIASKDCDSLLYGAERMAINLLGARRKAEKKQVVFKGAYGVELKKILKDLKVDHDQLIVLSMILGTDFNPAVVGVTPKRALQLVHKWADFSKLFKYAGWNYAYTWKEIYDCIKSIPVTNKYKLKWDQPDIPALEKFLLERSFEKKKVSTFLSRL